MVHVSSALPPESPQDQFGDTDVHGKTPRVSQQAFSKNQLTNHFSNRSNLLGQQQNSFWDRESNDQLLRWRLPIVGATRAVFFALEFPGVVALDQTCVYGKAPSHYLYSQFQKEGVRGLYRGGITAFMRACLWTPRLKVIDTVNRNTKQLHPFIYTPLMGITVSTFDLMFTKPLTVMRLYMASQPESKSSFIQQFEDQSKNQFKNQIKGQFMGSHKRLSYKDVFKMSLLYRHSGAVWFTNILGWGTYLTSDRYWRRAFCALSGRTELSLYDNAFVGTATGISTTLISSIPRATVTFLQSPAADHFTGGFLQGTQEVCKRMQWSGFLKYARGSILVYLPGNIVVASALWWLDQ